MILDNIPKDQVNAMFQRGILDESPSVAATCVSAICLYLEDYEKPQEYQSIIDPLLNVLVNLVNSPDSDEDLTLKTLGSVSEFALSHAKLFKNQLKSLGEFVCGVMKSSVESSVQQALLDFILTLIEQVHPYSPSLLTYLLTFYVHLTIHNRTQLSQ